MDSETKRRIDTARDILVGKVPDPKSQVEQITIAMVYKFMDDMDAESEEFGGERKFFAGEFQQYGWAKLMRSGLGGHEMLGLYAEAITKMPENPGIPPLFRDIFKNAYLPYRDPETLRSFLKIIDEFTYDHSERLGDAFEYLLSIMSSQGDAGQFRTPRHIIDFMVEIIDPKKNETVMDPACGTAGFLISSYKHIVNANKDDKGNSTLTPDEKGKLAQNFNGYDISPDMVRLSLVNMYLHGFADPHISEYDTLTNQENWNDYADVILANPPFMSPKGGIKPHNRFSVKSNRSEVLFVDYIAEHLTTNGRAAVIVPEGIIFQSGTAYKQLRKMLVETCLVAVISLPSGVFNPYASVKTSILYLDKAVSKKTDSIIFAKIYKDGFDLGAQRKISKENDIPEVIRFINQFLDENKRNNISNEVNSELGFFVKKNRIFESLDFNLSADRYIEKKPIFSKYDLVKLEEFCEFSSGLWKSEKEPLQIVKIIRNTNFSKNGFLILDDVAEHPVETRQLASRILEPGDLILEKSGGGPTQPVGRVVYFNIKEGIYSFSNFTTRIRVSDKNVNPYFLWNILNFLYKNGVTEKLQNQTSGIRNLDLQAYKSLQIPLPPLEIQHEIVDEIESYQKIIDGARMVVENYRPRIPVNPEWPICRLDEICLINPDTINPTIKYPNEIFYYIDISSIENGTGRFLGYSEIPSSEAPSRARRGVMDNDIIISTVRPNLKAFAILNNLHERAVASTGFAVLRVNNDKASAKFLLPYLFSEYVLQQMESMMGKGAYPSINQSDVASIKILLPPLDEQQKIAHIIENEQQIINLNRKLIILFEQKIQRVVSRVWGETQ